MCDPWLQSSGARGEDRGVTLEAIILTSNERKPTVSRAVSWILFRVLLKNSPWDSLSDSSEQRGAEGGQRGYSLGRGIRAVRYTSQWELWGSESSVHAFSALLCMGRCKNLGSLEELFGANLLGGPVVRTQAFRCLCPSFNPCWGTQILQVSRCGYVFCFFPLRYLQPS